ncbi:spore photoproduct lyase [Clostridium botulinum]|uniref:Spore photoproduct lyase n=2 Tax=Clostridium botulinum TaxID=1491 RepID=A0A9Q1ZBD3_CLOBO|nr:spore photoproduct lyase [Clostridium botulinum]AEB77428.1 spore photoproduct lyase [Clostridium botulinum BKT015925]KEH96026.1 spore photoproduct lyase [Clostridium botulinum C/D str. Sp77]KEH96985.1 Spore photoproduct lyase [Clostridium botulinum D str. 16868]KLU74602.1 Spore photoproduct lyase [Clostridium botulinum V891]KOA75854.1 Spore photoproduct lyase [Clostridium botulinum]
MFIPNRILFQNNALKYDVGKNIYNKFKDNKNVEIINISSNNIKKYIPGTDIREFYKEGKNTLIVGVKKGFKFQSCKPSAHYQLPLLSGCIGHCQYCYLNTNLGDKPYIKVNANIEDILKKAQQYIDERLPDITIFEGAATSDPVPIEPYSGLLKTTIEFFGKSEHGRFRFVTKYNDIDELLDIDHNEKTEIRFTINTNKVITDYEKRTASIKSRIDASAKIAKAGYPVGFIIAPVFIYDGWKKDYENLILDLKSNLPSDQKHPFTFEVISHRYTTRAKNIISEVFPDNTLPMNDEDRTYKYGQFGYGKYVYKKQELTDIKEFFTKTINMHFPKSDIMYII